MIRNILHWLVTVADFHPRELWFFLFWQKTFYHVICSLFTKVPKICVEKRFKILYNETDFWSRTFPVYE